MKYLLIVLIMSLSACTFFSDLNGVVHSLEPSGGHTDETEDEGEKQ